MGVKISVIVPVYNGERFIEPVMNSLLSQTFQETQFIFVNDGSKDRTGELLEEYARQYPEKIVVITQENGGVSVARNTGLRYATGEYIAFVDADDQLHPQYFEVLYQHASAESGRIAVVATAHCAEAANLGTQTAKTMSGVPLLEAFLYGKVTTGVWGMLIPREIIMGNDLQFKAGFKYSEDLHMVWRLFCHAKEVVFVDSPLYIYIEVPGSAMTKIYADRLDSLRLMQDLEVYFKTHKPEFSGLFDRYGTARMAWSLLWQAAHYLDYPAFAQFVEIHDFAAEMKKLRGFKDARVTLSAACFRFSKRVYHMGVSLITKRYRSC